MKKLFLTSSVGTPGVAESIYLKIATNNKLKTAFITTPVEVEDMSDDEWYQEDRHALQNAGFDLLDYTITGKNESQVKEMLRKIDVLYISGGNEFWLKHQSNKCNFGVLVKQFVENGKVYIGTSAGSIIMAPDMSPALQITDPQNCPEEITDLSGFEIVDFLPMPHWGSKEFKDVYLGTRKDKMYQEKWKIILLNNYEYIEVLGDQYHIVDVRDNK